MDVTKFDFHARLLDIIVAISEASFVSFDLELSGVPVKQPGGAAGKPELQDRYLETKQAAEKFQILQIGITCVSEDQNLGVYLCKPYNFNLSPIIEEKRLDIDRTFSFHSGAVDFLLGVGFQIQLPFTHGVPYLSRAEALLAEQIAAARTDRSTIADIQIKAEDVQSIAFLRRVRDEINAWEALNQPFLIISPLKEHGQSAEPELSRFERRLVHQLVRAEYPKLVTVSSRGMMRIMKFDHQREARIKAERIKEARDRIDKQTGFRWIIEALAGNLPSRMDPKHFAVSPETGYSMPADLDRLSSKYQRAQNLLANKRTVLVGHNMFLDLIYLYKTFIGPLPDHVDEFTALIHDIFPLIVDTKYMATHNCGDINPRSSLEEIAEQLSLQQYPLLETHTDHAKYRGTTAFHEAGYDSLLTAQVAVRLSNKLEVAGTYIDDISEPEDSGGVRLNGAAANFTPGNQAASAPTALTLESNLGKPEKLTLGDNEMDIMATNSNNRNLKQLKKSRQQSEPSLSVRFAHATVFDQLRDTAADESEQEEVLQFDDLPTTSSASAPVVADTDGVSEGTIAPSDWDTPYWRRQGGRAMPRFESDFWSVYGNKLRVFGTQEGVCLLDRS